MLILTSSLGNNVSVLTSFPYQLHFTLLPSNADYNFIFEINKLKLIEKIQKMYFSLPYYIFQYTKNFIKIFKEAIEL